MLSQLQAEKQLSAIEAAAVPHMKPEAQRESLQRHSRQIDDADKAKPKRLTPSDIGSLPFATQLVPKEEVSADG